MSEAELENIHAALAAIESGMTGDSQEGQLLDFKEDPAYYPRNRNPDATLIEFLIDETICFSNADAGVAYIVLGVSDKKSGPEAFTGTSRNIEWIEQKIFRGTRPGIRVEGTELYHCGARLICLRIPKGIALYQRPKGQASIRRGASCEPLSEEERRTIAFERANPDFSATVSRYSIDDLDLTAIDQARQLLRRARSAAGSLDGEPHTSLELLAELGLLTADGQLTFAAEILFVPPTNNRTTIRHLAREVPGGEPKATEISAPLITAYLRLKELVATSARQEIARVTFTNGQEISIPAFPETAVDEVISNALAHRDWDATSAVVIDQSPTALTVWSPGSLPLGVTADRILTTQSIPRNPRLMAALRMLDLAEESSRGFDRMWASMLASGRRIPTLHAAENFVEVTLSSGDVDIDFVRSLARLRENYSQGAFESITGLLIARHLMDNKILLTRTAAALMQSYEQQTQDTLLWYASIGYLEQLRDAEEWVLSNNARKLMGLAREGTIASASIQDWILTQLESGEAIVSRKVATELGVDRKIVTDILRHLKNMGRAKIDPTGPQRGPNTRWVTCP
ncbi:ATP-binding protein [uncultured Corynebacterium sp.]|uniref:ATP-binding protein n=1 Tax=uncultured Corynebacterium sp. TaxID=159447 RepID=UPI00260D7EB6|nr:ATP-binding protein [uncultured Corynebacterium sp.]